MNSHVIHTIYRKYIIPKFTINLMAISALLRTCKRSHAEKRFGYFKIYKYHNCLLSWLMRKVFRGTIMFWIYFDRVGFVLST